MGVVLSTHTEISPLSLISTTIGFVSFAFTVATFLRVSWENLQTIAAAQTQIPDFLGNLKQGLYEERAHLRKVRRFQRRRSSFVGGARNRLRKRRGSGTNRYPNNNNGYSSASEKEIIGMRLDSHAVTDAKDIHDDDVSTRVMREAIRHLIRDFRELERPFLRDDVEMGRSPSHDPNVRNGEGYAPSDDDDYYKTEYRKAGFRERYLWLRKKGDVVEMMNTLARLETRRIAKEIGDACLIVRGVERDIQLVDDRVWGMEQRMTRVVGIRRVDPS
ncbi:uncharacterized protein J3D65DRAFT_665805 [Phyllosticta citribraziliensis]|uniref:Uncharacterized protein n=1 Tax=Phyllosticta citribraziliensis TaxID=989973 RepID=A0ABR1M0U4_9PEZI